MPTGYKKALFNRYRHPKNSKIALQYPKHHRLDLFDIKNKNQ